MSFRKHAFSGILAAILTGSAGPTLAQDGELAAPNPGVVVEIYVHEDGTEIVCPTTACNAVCRDLEGTQVLLADTFYRIGSNCSLTITDGALLQEAIETVIALLGDEFPGGPGQDQGTTQNFLQSTTANPNQNTVPVTSAVAPVQISP